MHKITQKVASAALAVSMLFSMFSVNVVAFADEFQDDTTVSDDAAGTPTSGNNEVDAVDSIDDTGASDSETVSPPSNDSEPSATVTDVVDRTHDSTISSVKDDTQTADEVIQVDPNESEEIATSETAKSDFVGIQTVTPDYGDNITAEIGDTVTLDALLNRTLL